MSVTSPILISGGGISGLALAQALLKASIPFHVYERDPYLSFRPQGYRFRVQAAGVDALRQLLPEKLFKRVQATCAISSGTVGPPTVLDAITAKPGPRGGFSRPGLGGPPGGGPPVNIPQSGAPPFFSVDRSVLRSVLMLGLEDHMSFGKEFVSYEIHDSGITIAFTDGSTATGSFLVAADGATSRIRKQFLPERKLVDTEGRLIYGKTLLTPEIESTFNADSLKTMTLIRDKTIQTGGQNLSLLLECIRFEDNEFRATLPHDYIYWVLIARADTLALPDDVLLKKNSAEAVAYSKELTEKWDPSFKPLFELQSPEYTAVMRIASTNSPFLGWKTSSRVTLMGDAAHVMSPSAGLGATTAIRDAAALAKVIIEEGVSEHSIEEYEKEMRGWATEALEFSAQGGKSLFGMKLFDELKEI
jgi:2-polyprenyl-6-methoxyphenol hydroxylase-like FAD-dependent oxidoreductase